MEPIRLTLLLSRCFITAIVPLTRTLPNNQSTLTPVWALPSESTPSRPSNSLCEDTQAHKGNLPTVTVLFWGRSGTHLLLSTDGHRLSTNPLPKAPLSALPGSGLSSLYLVSVTALTSRGWGEDSGQQQGQQPWLTMQSIPPGHRSCHHIKEPDPDKGTILHVPHSHCKPLSA